MKKEMGKAKKSLPLLSLAVRVEIGRQGVSTMQGICLTQDHQEKGLW
jgi:hypothetical protein